MMVDRRTLVRDDRPCIARALRDAGLRLLVPDLRGHGESRGAPPGARPGGWSYDDLVHDTSHYLELARELEPEAPIVLVGHSMFGHTSLAWLGRHPDAPLRAQVLIAVSHWVRRHNRGRLRWLAKRAAIETAWALARRSGHLPARRLGMGSDDVSTAYVGRLVDQVRRDRWGSRDGADYSAGLSQVRCPTLHVASVGDRWVGRPDEALRLTADLPDREAWVLGAYAPDPRLAELRPGHMELVTSPSCAPLWSAIACWIVAQLG